MDAAAQALVSALAYIEHGERPRSRKNAAGFVREAQRYIGLARAELAWLMDDEQQAAPAAE